jgi:putative inorganic carbon (HCO3(-)) transporter
MAQTTSELGAAARAGTDRLVFRVALAGLVAAAFGLLPEVAQAAGVRLYATELTFLLLLGAVGAWVLRARRVAQLANVQTVPVFNDATRPGLARPLVPLLSYGVVVAAGILFAHDPGRSIEATKALAISAAQLFAVVLLVTSPGAIRTVAWAVTATASVIAGVNLVQHFTGQFANDYLGLARPVFETPGGEISYLIGGPFGDPNYLAQRLVVALPIGVSLVWTSTSWTLKAIAAGAVALCVAALAVTGSRGGLLTLLVVAILLIATIVPRKWYLAAGVALLLLLGLLLVPAQTRAPFASALNEARSLFTAPNEAIAGRAREWRVATAMYADHAVVGVGAGNFPNRYLDYAVDTGADLRPEERAPHNMFVEIATETGIVGLIVFGIIVVTALESLRRARLRLRTAPRAAGMVDAFGIALAGYAVSGMFLGLAYSDLLWVLLGTAFASVQVASIGSGHAFADDPA